MNTFEQLEHIAPAFSLLAGAAVVLIADLATERRVASQLLSLAVLAVAALLTFWQVAAGLSGESALAGAVAEEYRELGRAVGVTAEGCEIFTLSPGGLDRPGLPG